MYRIIAAGLVALFLLTGAVQRAVAEAATDQLEALLEQGKAGEAYRQISQSVKADGKLLESYAFLMAAGKVMQAHSRDDPPGNAGESYRVRLQAGAVEAFEMAERLAEPDGIEHTMATTARALARSEMGRAATLAFEQKRFDLALDYSRAIVRVSPDDRLGPVILIGVGQAVDRQELQLEGARAAVEARFPLAQYYVLAASLESDAEGGRGLDAALRHLATGLEVMPNDLELLGERVRYLLMAEREADATAAFEQFRVQTFAQFEQPADRVPYLFFLGFYSQSLGQPEAARGFYQALIEHKPDHFEARFGLGNLLVDEANALRRRALDLPFEAIDEARGLERQANAIVRQAKAHFEAIHDPQAPRSEVMVALMTIYGQLEDFEAMRDMRAQYDRYMRGPRR